jgi:hypothetical protein
MVRAEGHDWRPNSDMNLVWVRRGGRVREGGECGGGWGREEEGEGGERGG